MYADNDGSWRGVVDALGHEYIGGDLDAGGLVVRLGDIEGLKYCGLDAMQDVDELLEPRVANNNV